MASALATELVENAIVADRFRLVRRLGRGGMGSVWLAHHLGLDVPCAIKFIDADLRQHPEIRARLEREAKAEAQLRSPHVVQIFDHGIWNDTPYIVMEYLHGESLATRLERVGRLDPDATHRLVAHVARALTKAHLAGIVHRDLKPENIFLIDDDDGEIAKVVDFGVAKFARADWAVDRVTKDGLLVGTPLYMSPEQARGTDDVDYRSDLWSLAVIAFQCLTGRLPFYSDGLGDLLAKIMFEPLPMPTTFAPELPGAVDGWWERGAARERTERFQSAKELADSLANAFGISGGAHVATVPPGGRASLVEIHAGLNGYSTATTDLSAATSLWGRSFLAWSRSWFSRPTHKAMAAALAGCTVLVLFLALIHRKSSASDEARAIERGGAPASTAAIGGGSGRSSAEGALGVTSGSRSNGSTARPTTPAGVDSTTPVPLEEPSAAQAHDDRASGASAEQIAGQIRAGALGSKPSRSNESAEGAVAASRAAHAQGASGTPSRGRAAREPTATSPNTGAKLPSTPARKKVVDFGF